MWLHRSYALIITGFSLLALALAGFLVSQEAGSVYLDLRHLLFFFLLGLLLNNMASHLPGAGRRYAMAFFAPMLLMGPAVTVLLASAAGLSQTLLIALRSLGAGRLKRPSQPHRARTAPAHSLAAYGEAEVVLPLVRHLFGVAQCAVALMCAGQIYLLLGGKVGRLQMPGNLVPAAIAAACLLLLEAMISETATALERDRPLLATWRNSLIYTLPLEASLAGLGLLLALLYQQPQSLLPADRAVHPLGVVFIAFVVLIPCWLLYYSYRLYLEMRQAYARTLRTLAGLVEDRLQSRHSQETSRAGEKTRQIAEYASAVAEQVGLSPTQVEQVRFAAYLLDVGKMGLPRELLVKQDGFVSPRQRRAYARHVEIAGQILEPVKFLQPVAQLIRHHQERYDGLGYPAGLRGEEIPVGSRILACVQAFVELTQPSEPGVALEADAAVARLYTNQGIRFDPKVLEALALTLRHRNIIRDASRYQVLPAGASPGAGYRL